ncbi:MAG: hypothetical protein AB3N64_10360, partial [Puniceicoccaceae bacterium]
MNPLHLFARSGVKHLRKLRLALLVSVLLSGSDMMAQNGDLIAYEGFGYDVGTSIEFREGGFGWRGPWVWRSYFDGKGTSVLGGAVIQRGSLRYGDLETTGHHVLFSGETNNLELGRGFAETIAGEPGTSTYISFLGQRQGQPMNTGSAGYPWGENAYPRGASLRFFNTSKGEQLSIGNTSNQNVDEWSIYGQSLIEHTGNSFSDAVSFIVVRIDHQADSLEDNIYMWVNPSLDEEASPASAQVAVIGDEKDGDFIDYANLDYISPFAGNESSGRLHAEWILDELRVGQTWESVTPTVPQWAGYKRFEEIYVDTGRLLGLLGLADAPWLWNYNCETWMYCEEDWVTPYGTWLMAWDLEPPLDTVEGETWMGRPVDGNGIVDTGRFLNWLYVAGHPWVWSYNLETWLYVLADASGTPASVWAFAIDSNDLSLPLGPAVNPVPADGDMHVEELDDSVQLSWISGTGVVSHDLYFGTDREAVSAAGPDDPEFLGAIAGATWTVEGLNSLYPYYWRVDARGGSGDVIKGNVWTFQTRQLAFAGAEGYGRFARGGRGGVVYTVTNLNDSGPGSLREALEADGPRTIVFNVGGLITLDSPLLINDQQVYVAGQTAPGKGITIRKYKFGMSGAEDVVVRHLRVRVGNIAGITTDGMGLQGSDHCIIDHCSISWTIDEAFSSRAAKNITLQNTLIAEALNVAGHKNYPPGSAHGYAASISGLIGSFHHNLLAHCAGRNWSLAGGLDNAGLHTGSLDIRNNVVYNWDGRTTDGGAQYVNFVGNYYKPGAASDQLRFLNPERNNGFGPQDYFVEGNIMEGYVDETNQLDGISEPEPYENFLVDEPFFPSYISEDSARDAYKRVLSEAGANVPLRDDMDTRIIGETLAGSTTYSGSVSGLPGLPDSQEDVGGWEDYPETYRPVDWDTDLDGLPDWWEDLRGLNPASEAGDFSDSNADIDGDERTEMDAYLDWMAQPNLHCLPGVSVSFDVESR